MKHNPVTATRKLWRFVRNDPLDRAEALLATCDKATREENAVRLNDILYGLEQLQGDVNKIMCHTDWKEDRHKRARKIWIKIREARTRAGQVPEVGKLGLAA